MDVDLLQMLASMRPDLTVLKPFDLLQRSSEECLFLMLGYEESKARQFLLPYFNCVQKVERESERRW